MSLFKDSQGNFSSKRVFGAVLIVAGLVAGYFGAFGELGIVVDYSKWVIGFGAGVLGIGVFEKLKA